MSLDPKATLEIVRNHLNQISEITDSDWEFFSSKLKRRDIPRKTIFLKLGDVENHISFIISGIVRLYIPKSDPDKEITFGFSFKDQFISAYDSFLTRKSSLYELQTLTNATLLSISHEDLQAVYKTTKIGNLIGRLTAERLFLLKSKREQTLLHYTAEERYLDLFKDRPEVIKEIPLKYISSYIGVTPQALSRIRKRIT
jgi:CRP-like cAMP-binding protein